MKTKIIIVALLLLSSICQSQITLEHSYPPTNNDCSLGVVNLTNSGYKYLVQDGINYTVKLYNLNHSLWKTITLNVPTGYTYGGAYNISENLFNLDGLVDIEYIYYQYVSTPKPHEHYVTNIINENGSMLLSLPNCSGGSVWSTGANGCKLTATIDSTNSSGIDSLNIYSLPGTMPSSNIIENGSNNIDALSYPYPNPSKSTVTINYQLPIGINSAEIVFYNLAGTEIKRFQVDNTFNTLEINNSDLPAGTYIYNLVTPNNISSAKKMVVIK